MGYYWEWISENSVFLFVWNMKKSRTYRLWKKNNKIEALYVLSDKRHKRFWIWFSVIQIWNQSLHTLLQSTKLFEFNLSYAMISKYENMLKFIDFYNLVVFKSELWNILFVIQVILVLLMHLIRCFA